MCRLLGYVGPSVSLHRLMIEPPHSIVVQGYAPKELEVALMNADGFGFGWHPADPTVEPFTYRNTMPIWNDPNLSPLCRYIESGCALAYVRSATPGQGVDISNCQPFQSGSWLFVHNGYIKQFRETLYRPLRNRLGDRAYLAIEGSTDSEHIWALVLNAIAEQPSLSLVAALAQALATLAELAQAHCTPLAANVLISDGQRLVGARFAAHGCAPSLYWLRDDSRFPEATLVASEPLFEGHWEACPDPSLFTVEANRDLQFHPFPHVAHRRP